MADRDNPPEAPPAEQAPAEGEGGYRGMELIPQKQGGAIYPGQRPGEPGRNPWGRGGKHGRFALMKALERAANEGGIEKMVETIMEVATNPKHPQVVAAFRAVCDALQRGEEQQEADGVKDALQRRKVRLVDYEIKGEDTEEREP